MTYDVKSCWPDTGQWAYELRITNTLFANNGANYCQTMFWKPGPKTKTIINWHVRCVMWHGQWTHVTCVMWYLAVGTHLTSDLVIWALASGYCLAGISDRYYYLVSLPIVTTFSAPIILVSIDYCILRFIHAVCTYLPMHVCRSSPKPLLFSVYRCVCVCVCMCVCVYDLWVLVCALYNMYTVSSYIYVLTVTTVYMFKLVQFCSLLIAVFCEVLCFNVWKRLKRLNFGQVRTFERSSLTDVRWQNPTEPLHHSIDIL